MYITAKQHITRKVLQVSACADHQQGVILTGLFFYAKS